MLSDLGWTQFGLQPRSQLNKDCKCGPWPATCRPAVLRKYGRYSPHLRHFTVVLNLINRPAASLIGIFTVTLNTGDFYGEIFPISSLDQIGPELSDGLRAIDRLHARRH